MKLIKIIVLSTLAASLIWMLGACEHAPKSTNEENQSILDAPVITQPYIDSSASDARGTENIAEASRKAEESQAAAESSLKEAAERAEPHRVSYEPLEIPDSQPQQLNDPPNLTFQYEFGLGETRLVHMVFLFPVTYTWTTEDDNGTSTTIEVNGGRPCESKNPRRIKLEDVADSDYMIDLALKESFTESYSLLAYPADNLQNGTPCTIQDGKLTLFRTPHYYELTVQYTQGTVIYGFFVD